MAAVVELEACLSEVQAMLAKATRPAVKEELERVMGVLQAELEEAKKKEAAIVVSPTEAAAAETKLLLTVAKLPRVKQELEVMLQKFGGPEALEKAAGSYQPPTLPQEKKLKAGDAAAKAPAAAKDAAAPATGVTPTKGDAGAEQKSIQKPAKEEHKPVKVDVRSSGPWTEITTYAQDLGGYSGGFVSVDLRLKGVEQIPKESVQCTFTTSSFDLQVLGLDGKNYRMLKTNLDKDIVVADSSVKIKKNHVIVSLAKVKGEYGFDSWMDLCAKGPRRTGAAKDANPQASIMGMMQDMYNDGDDSMKKIIGEAMTKAHTGEKGQPSMGSMGSDSLDDL